MSIEVKNISKTFGAFKALDQVNLLVPKGELVALLGPSGSGKTTLLRIIAGLEVPDPDEAAAILFNGQNVDRAHVGKRQVGFVFQHYALFRHMSVFENIAFGLRVRPRKTRPSKADIKARVLELLRLVQLSGMEGRYPSQLSGGQRQRVALARALAVEPQVLLLDEPFGALDARVRQELRQWLRRLHDEIHVTSVFVTHDQEEALEVADRIVVMNKGRIAQEGTPDEVFHHPANEFVMHFLGNVNLFHARMEAGKPVTDEMVVAPDAASKRAPQNGSARVFVRPHELDIVTSRPGTTNAISARVERIQSAGPQVKVELIAADGNRLNAELTHERFKHLHITRGTDVFVIPREVRVFTEDYAI